MSLLDGGPPHCRRSVHFYTRCASSCEIAQRSELGPFVGRPRLRRLPARAPRRPVEEQSTFAYVLRQRCSALEFLAGLLQAAELAEQVAPDAREQVITPQSAVGNERIDQGKARRGAGSHR